MRRSSFYTFFFTHTAQLVNYQQGVNTWIEPMRPVSFFRPEFQDQNNLYFLISSFQPEGTITIQLDKGHYLLDTSSSLLINTTITADRTIQDVSSFRSTLRTPITSPALTTEYLLKWQNQQISRVYPQTFFAPVVDGVYPFQTVSTQRYTINPVFVESLDYYERISGNSGVTYNSLTIDNSKIRLDQSHIPDDLANNLLTTDKTGFYVLTPTNQIVLDASVNELSTKRVLVSGIAEGNVLVSWTVGDLITSQVYYPSFGRGFLPASTLSLKMEGAMLYEIALSILTLVAIKDEVLLLSVLTELSYVWAFVLNNANKSDVIPGFPSFLPRTIFTSNLSFSSIRSTLQQAWIGYAITKAVVFLRSRPNALITLLPAYLPELLNQLALVVANAIDPATGVTFTGYDEFGYLNDQVDLSAAVVAEMFLQEYLSVHYDAMIHCAAARVHIYLLENLKVQFQDSSPEHWAPLYKLLWNVIHQRHFDTDALVNLIHIQSISNSMCDFQMGLWRFLLARLPKVYSFINYEDVSNSFVEIDLGLHERRRNNTTQEKIPSLVVSSWMQLLKAEGEYILNQHGQVQLDPQNNIRRTPATNPTLLPSLTFSLGAVDALGFQTFVYLEAQRMLPFGYQWSSEKANTEGRIGALLKAIAQLGFNWFLQNREVYLGQYLSQAQGAALDQWARFLNYPRHLLQPDNFLRSQLLPLLRQNRVTLSSLINIAQRQGVNAMFVEPVPSSVLLNGQAVNWQSLTPNQIRQFSEATEFFVQRDLYPTSVRLAQGNEQRVVWDKITPFIVVYTNGVVPSFTSELLNSLPASVFVRLYAQLSYESEVQTIATGMVRRQ